MKAPILRFDSCAAGYARKTILRDISFAVWQGENIGILGANGSGKSTLLKSVAGQAQILAGQMTLNGQDIKRFSPRQRARFVAAASTAEQPLPGRTALQFILLGRYPWLGFWGQYDAQDHAIAAKALAAVRLADLAERDIATLSQGQWRLVSFARCLAQIWTVPVPLLLLDEQTANLDISHKLALTFLLEQWRKRPCAILQAMHDYNLAAIACTHLLGLKNGRQIFFGPVAEVFTAENLSELYDWPLTLGRHEQLAVPQASANFPSGWLPPGCSSGQGRADLR